MVWNLSQKEVKVGPHLRKAAIYATHRKGERRGSQDQAGEREIGVSPATHRVTFGT